VKSDMPATVFICVRLPDRTNNTDMTTGLYQIKYI